MTFSEDHPEVEPINMELRDQAYYISYRYTAGEDEELIVKFTVADDEIQGAPGSFHLYGLTNQVSSPPSDLDADGLPDSWEEKLVDNLDDLNGNGAGPGPGAGTGDFDGDGLTDLDEYEETKTDPTKADTDGDGLGDAVETNTGTYVSATNTGTDPKKADTDKDGLADGVETNTGELVDEENTGTNPLNADTDGDGYSDGGEIAGGTDPNDENSKGAIPAPFLYLDFESEATDLSQNEYNGEVDGDVTFDVEGAEGGPTPTTGASFNGGHLDFFDIDMNSMIRDFGDGSYTFACWMKPIGSAGGQGFMWGQTQQGIHNGIRMVESFTVRTGVRTGMLQRFLKPSSGFMRHGRMTELMTKQRFTSMDKLMAVQQHSVQPTVVEPLSLVDVTTGSFLIMVMLMM